MHSDWLWFALAAPAALLAIAVSPVSPGRAGTNSLGRCGTLASALTLVVSLGMVVAVVRSGSMYTSLVGNAGIGFSVYSDALTATMISLVSFVGFTVVRYSRNYLDGDPTHMRFLRHSLAFCS